jgi:hypothetical protein
LRKQYVKLVSAKAEQFKNQLPPCQEPRFCPRGQAPLKRRRPIGYKIEELPTTLSLVSDVRSKTRSKAESSQEARKERVVGSDTATDRGVTIYSPIGVFSAFLVTKKAYIPFLYGRMYAFLVKIPLYLY